MEYVVVTVLCLLIGAAHIVRTSRIGKVHGSWIMPRKRNQAFFGKAVSNNASRFMHLLKDQDTEWGKVLRSICNNRSEPAKIDEITSSYNIRANEAISKMSKPDYIAHLISAASIFALGAVWIWSGNYSFKMWLIVGLGVIEIIYLRLLAWHLRRFLCRAWHKSNTQITAIAELFKSHHKHEQERVAKA